jgi:hypothetical protein
MVVQQFMKAAVALESEQPANLRKAAQNQLQQALSLYLRELASR